MCIYICIYVLEMMLRASMAQHAPAKKQKRPHCQVGDAGGEIDYYGMFRFHHRNNFLRELFGRINSGRAPSLMVLGIGNHELNAVRALATEEVVLVCTYVYI